MSESNGGNDENVSNSSGSSSRSESTALTVRVSGGSFRGIADKILRKDQTPAESPSVPTEVRRVRRGKFFLSNYEQRTYGSMRQPIFQYWGHGVVVGEMVPFLRTQDSDPEGMWCYGAHNDFDLVPEFMKPSEWPEYIRTPTGWIRKDSARRLETVDPDLVKKAVEFQRKSLRLLNEKGET